MEDDMGSSGGENGEGEDWTLRSIERADSSAEQEPQVSI